MIIFMKIFHETDGPMIIMATCFVSNFVSLKSHDVTLITNTCVSSSPSCSSTFLAVHAEETIFRKTTLFFPLPPF